MPEWLTCMASYANNRECIGDNRHWDGDIKWPIWWYQRLYLGIMLTRVDDMRDSIIPVRLPCLLPGAPLTSVVLSEVSRVAGRVWVMYQRIKSQIARNMGPAWVLSAPDGPTVWNSPVVWFLRLPCVLLFLLYYQWLCVIEPLVNKKYCYYYATVPYGAAPLWRRQFLQSPHYRHSIAGP